MRTAVVIGGTGLVGRMIARLPLAVGWGMTVTGRERGHCPADLAEARFGFAGWFDHAAEDAYAHRDDP